MSLNNPFGPTPKAAVAIEGFTKCLVFFFLIAILLLKLGFQVSSSSITYNFSLRNCNRYIKLVSITYNFIRNSSSYSLAKVILFHLLLAIKMTDIGLYNKIVNGNAEIEFKNIILQSEELIKVFNHYFQTEDDKSNLTFDFSQLYNCIFNNTKEGWEEITIGSKTIEYAQERKILFEMLTFMNDFVIYQ